MMTAPAVPQRYYNPARRLSPSPYRLSLPSQSEVFSRYQSQQCVPQAHLPWRGPERPAGLTHSTPMPTPQQPWRPSNRLANNSLDGLRRQAPPPFRQTFMLQRQHYPINDQWYQQPSLPAVANHDTALHGGQITQSTSRAPGNATNRPQAAPYQVIPRQPYQSGQSQRVYQYAVEKGVYQVDDKDFENRPEGFYTTFDPEGKEVDYFDEGFEEVIANFVGIETVCSKCSSSFRSKLQLHKHLKAGCTGAVQVTPLPPTQPPSPITIVKSNAIIPLLESGLAFQGWTYTTTSITLVPHLLSPDLDPAATACLDTGCGVTLIDKEWLLSHLLHQKISTISTLLNVREIGTSKHKSVQFAALSLYFPGKDETGQRVYASIKCELHLVDGL